MVEVRDLLPADPVDLLVPLHVVVRTHLPQKPGIDLQVHLACLQTPRHLLFHCAFRYLDQRGVAVELVEHEQPVDWQPAQARTVVLVHHRLRFVLAFQVADQLRENHEEGVRRVRAHFLLDCLDELLWRPEFVLLCEEEVCYCLGFPLRVHFFEQPLALELRQGRHLQRPIERQLCEIGFLISKFLPLVHFLNSGNNVLHPGPQVRLDDLSVELPEIDEFVRVVFLLDWALQLEDRELVHQIFADAVELDDVLFRVLIEA